MTDTIAPVNVAGFNRRVALGRQRAEQHLPALERAYARLIREASREAARDFRALTAAATPDWQPPPAGTILGLSALGALAVERLTRVYRKIIKDVQEPALARIGISFDITHPITADLLSKAGGRTGAALGDAIQPVLVKAVAQGYADGLSVDDTAKLIQADIADAADWQAKMLARTDLNSLSNGGSVAAARQAGLTYKTWLTAHDEKVREEHQAADGQTVPVDQPFTVGGENLEYPGDPEGSDEEVINCRCTVIYADSLTASARPDVSGLAMVAVYPSADEAGAIAITDGVPAETLHVTMVFLGEVANLDLEAVSRAVEKVASSTTAMSGRVGGVGMFAKGPDGYPQLAIPNVQGLAELRTRLTDALRAEAVASPSEHDWVPHMTLTYADEPALPDLSVIGSDLTFGTLSLSVADERTDFELGGAMKPLTAAVTITVDEAQSAPVAWRSDLAFEGMATEDGRYILPGALSWRDLPLTLMAMTVTSEGGHEGAFVAGRIDTMAKEQRDGMTAIVGTGLFDTGGEQGSEVARLVADETVRGVSVDLAINDYAFRDPETGEIIEPDEMDEADMERAYFGEMQMAVRDATIMAATVCPTPAFADAKIAVTASGQRVLRITSPLEIIVGPLTASAAGMTPAVPPEPWFYRKEPNQPVPLTVADSGEVFGHIAAWDSCHTGRTGVCVQPPRSPSGYAYFNAGEVRCENGRRVGCGQIFFHAEHAPLSLAGRRVLDHYAHTGLVGADVRAVDGRFGIWVSGALRSTLTVEEARAFMASKPSGDWRQMTPGGPLELVGVLAVNDPGFPVPRQLVASAEDADGDAVALTAAFDLPDDPAVERRLSILATRAEAGLDGLLDRAGV